MRALCCELCSVAAGLQIVMLVRVRACGARALLRAVLGSCQPGESKVRD